MIVSKSRCTAGLGVLLHWQLFSQSPRSLWADSFGSDVDVQSIYRWGALNHVGFFRQFLWTVMNMCILINWNTVQGTRIDAEYQWRWDYGQSKSLSWSKDFYETLRMRGCYQSVQLSNKLPIFATTSVVSGPHQTALALMVVGTLCSGCTSSWRTITRTWLHNTTRDDAAHKCFVLELQKMWKHFDPVKTFVEICVMKIFQRILE